MNDDEGVEIARTQAAADLRKMQRCGLLIRQGTYNGRRLIGDHVRHSIRFMTLMLCSVAAAASAHAGELPRLRTEDGRHALLVDGKPYLMLGAQVHNSSNYPSVLPQVWPVMQALSANTIEIPVAWEQFEPTEGRFDYSWVDTLLARRAKMTCALCCYGSEAGKTAIQPTRRNG